MAHFAKINSDNIVVNVHVVDNSKLLGEDGIESEANGIAHLERHGAESGFSWKQTSYNTSGGTHKLGGTPFRKNYAGIGYTYDAAKDAFISSKIFPSWILNEDTCQWEAPTAKPDDGKYYYWNEDTTQWKTPPAAPDDGKSYNWNEDTESWDEVPE